MNIGEKAACLRSTSFFASLSVDAALKIAADLTEKTIAPGEYLFQIEEPGDAMYIIVSGRLRVVIPQAGGSALNVRDMGPREVIGEIAMITDGRRTASTFAVRSTKLLVVSKAQFESIVSLSPEVALDIARRQIARLHDVQIPDARVRPCQIIVMIMAGGTEDMQNLPEVVNLELCKHDPCVLIRESDTRLTDDEQANEAFLDRLEESHTHIIYACDRPLSKKTHMLLERAGTFLLIAADGAEADRNNVEMAAQAVMKMRGEIVTHLILVSRDGMIAPVESWLIGRDIHLHHHLRKDNTQDLARLGRFLAGRAHGLVLGGGGARAFAHIGVIRALRELGIEIDAVGGTSMGSLIAGLTALGMDWETMVETCMRIFIKKGVFDFTIPVMSLISGNKMTASLADLFGHLQMENLPVKTFAVSTNLRNAEAVIHEQGPVAKWIRTSMAVPGIAPPLVASGMLLCDGGIIDNLPVARMTRFTPGRVIAVNVSPSDDFGIGEHWSDVVTPYQYFKGRFSTGASFPSILALLQRSALIGSSASAVAAGKSALHLFQPRVTQFGFFQWTAIREMVQIGYSSTMEQMAGEI